MRFLTVFSCSITPKHTAPDLEKQASWFTDHSISSGSNSFPAPHSQLLFAVKPFDPLHLAQTPGLSQEPLSGHKNLVSTPLPNFCLPLCVISFINYIVNRVYSCSLLCCCIHLLGEILKSLGLQQSFIWNVFTWNASYAEFNCVVS